MSSQSQEPIIIIKKVKGHGGHHGGAWKVAYADFVTAMMALFIVLWLLNSSQKVQVAVGGYFRDPKGAGKMVGSTKSGTGEGMTVQLQDMDKLKKKIEAAMKKEIKDFEKLREFVEITVTEEGLRVELMEAENSTFFEKGRPDPTTLGSQVLAELGVQLSQLPNDIVLEGHTDGHPFGLPNGFGNWELSSDRANAARRLMVEKGLAPERVAQVRGFADRRLRTPTEPLASSNRRVSVIVRFLPDLGDIKPDPGDKKTGVAAPHARHYPPAPHAHGWRPA